VNVSGLEAGATWQYQVDGGAWVVGAGTFFLLKGGSHTYAVRQVDFAGNPSLISSAVTYIYDSSPPTASFILPDRLTNTSTVSDQRNPSVSALSNGGYIVVWESLAQDNNYGDYGIYAQKYDASGAKSGGEFLVNLSTAKDQRNPTVMGLSNGDILFMWQSTHQNAGDIFMKRISSTGSELSGEVRVNTITANEQSGPQMVALKNGTYVALWNTYNYASPSDPDFGIAAQRYDAWFNKIGTEFKVNTQTAGRQISPAVTTALDSGGFLAVWQTSADTGSTGYNIAARVYDSKGVAANPEFQINAAVNVVGGGSAVLPQLTQLAGGDIVVVWQSNQADDSDIYARVLTSSGAPKGEEFRVNASANDLQSAPTIQTLSDGGFIVVWVGSSSSTGDADIFARRFDASGQALGSEIHINGAGFGIENRPAAALLKNGDLVISWDTSTDGGVTSSVYHKMYDSLGRELLSSGINGGAPVSLVGQASLQDDFDGLSSMLISISAGYVAGQDILLFRGKSFGDISLEYGISVEWLGASGQLKLSSLSAKLGAYQSLLTLLQYDNLQDASATSGDRIISAKMVDVAGNNSGDIDVAIVRVSGSVAPTTATLTLLATVDSTPVTHKITPTPTIGTDSHYDIALMMGSDQTISLGQLSSVEKIDLTGTGANKLTVALADVLQITTGNTALQNANIALKVVGDLGDTVDLVNSANDHWSKTGQITNAGEVFNVYHNDASTNLLADLWVKEVVQVNVV
jgi:hypothetical protein